MGNKVLTAYTTMDQIFEEGKLMYVAGKEDAEQGDLGTIILPKPAGNVSIAPTLPDPVLFSYTNTVANVIQLREVLVKIDSEANPPTPSTCTVSVLVPKVDEDWDTIVSDVTLVLSDGTTPALHNPHGLAEAGAYLYFIDYESRYIVIVGKDALEGATSGGSLQVSICDLSLPLPNANLPSDAKGQAIIALGAKIYALYLRTNPYATAHDPGQLLRLGNNNDGTLTYETKTEVGKNPQSIIPVKDNNEYAWLLIPAIGGPQDYEGNTNGTNSNISVVLALGNWASSAPIAVTGDSYTRPTPPNPPNPTAYDIHAVGAAMRNGNSRLFILTQVYNNQAKSAYWILYETSVTVFLDFLNRTTAPTLSEAKDLPGFELRDESIMVSPDVQIPYDIYFWDLLYEQTLRNDDEEDRLWLVLGSPFLVTKPEAYGSPTTPLGNPFVMFSCFGGVNVNSVDLTIETLRQAQREVSLKRGVRASKLGTAAARTARAATATTATAAEEGEENK
jgi:hypothetical protein